MGAVKKYEKETLVTLAIPKLGLYGSYDIKWTDSEVDERFNTIIQYLKDAGYEMKVEDEGKSCLDVIKVRMTMRAAMKVIIAFGVESYTIRAGYYDKPLS